MSGFDHQFLLLLMAGLAFLLGFITFAVGVVVLAVRASGSEVQSLAAQTTRLVNKGLTDEVAGLVGQASELMHAVNQMVQTARGVGTLLIFAGLVLMVAAGFLALQLSRG